ncbi:MAG: septum formation initiator family protein [Deltaproteobacteria bacterium]|jgi:cell division protein FtsB|nr:septum formation initiator family protein [Deltaproteobacteria bacterium]
MFNHKVKIEAKDPRLTEKPARSPKRSGLFFLLSGKILWSCFFLLVAGVMVNLFFSEEGLVRSSGLIEIKESLEADNRRLEDENRQLAARLERIRNDPRYLEDEARKKLGLVRPDEIIFRLAQEPELSDEEVREQLD